MSENETKTYGLPAYTSHKTVWAGKITKLKEFDDEGGIVEMQGGVDVEVSAKWIERHRPKDGNFAGGYFVVYKDGYNSWSPAEAFEEGNTLSSHKDERIAELIRKSIDIAEDLKKTHHAMDQLCSSIIALTMPE